MRRTHQVHAVAIAVICIVITVLYFLIGPPSAPPPGEHITGDRFIQIYSATWGESCNPAIAHAMSERASTPLPKDANGIAVVRTPLEPVITNNVLTQVGEQCNNHLTCVLPVTSNALGVEPLTACYKRLQVSYRCFSYDRLWNLDLRQGDTLKIDCNETAAPAAK